MSFISWALRTSDMLFLKKYLNLENNDPIDCKLRVKDLLTYRCIFCPSKLFCMLAITNLLAAKNEPQAQVFMHSFDTYWKQLRVTSD